MTERHSKFLGNQSGPPRIDAAIGMILDLALLTGAPPRTPKCELEHPEQLKSE